MKELYQCNDCGFLSTYYPGFMYVHGELHCEYCARVNHGSIRSINFKSSDVRWNWKGIYMLMSKEEFIEVAKLVEIHIQSDPAYKASIGLGYFSERFAKAYNKYLSKSSNSDYTKCAEDILKLDLVDKVINKKSVLVEILKRHFT